MKIHSKNKGLALCNPVKILPKIHHNLAVLWNETIDLLFPKKLHFLKEKKTAEMPKKPRHSNETLDTLLLLYVKFSQKRFPIKMIFLETQKWGFYVKKKIIKENIAEIWKIMIWKTEI